MILGAHVSVAGGLHTAFERGLQSTAQAIQIFTKSSNQWKAKELVAADIENWKLAQTKNATINPVLCHDSYLINLASPDEANWQKSRDAFQVEIERCSQLGIGYLVTHAGSHVGSGEEVGIARIAEAVNRLHAEKGFPNVTILFETTAGQGTALGYKFEHWGQLLEQLQHPEWVGFCLDTCHVFAAGYDITTPEGYTSTMNQFQEHIGLEKLQAFHLNDSKKGLGCRVDRHENIGKGALGTEPFRFLVNDARFKDTPAILETPAIDDNNDGFAENLKILRDLIA
jgi:deoxyribonuclease-4